MRNIHVGEEVSSLETKFQQDGLALALLHPFLSRRGREGGGVVAEEEEEKDDLADNFLARWQVWVDRFSLALSSTVQKWMHQLETMMRASEAELSPVAREFLQMHHRPAIPERDVTELLTDDDIDHVVTADSVFAKRFCRELYRREPINTSSKKNTVREILRRRETRRRAKAWLLRRLQRLSHHVRDFDPNVAYDRVLQRVLTQELGPYACVYIIEVIRRHATPLGVSVLTSDAIETVLTKRDVDPVAAEQYEILSRIKAAEEGSESVHSGPRSALVVSSSEEDSDSSKNGHAVVRTRHDDYVPAAAADGSVDGRRALSIAESEVQSSQFRRTASGGIGIIVRVSPHNDFKIAKQVAELNEAFHVSGALRIVLMEDWPQSLPRHNHAPVLLSGVVVSRGAPAQDLPVVVDGGQPEVRGAAASVEDGTVLSGTKNDTNGSLGNGTKNNGTISSPYLLPPRRDAHFSFQHTERPVSILHPGELDADSLLWRKHHASIRPEQVAVSHLRDLGYSRGWLCDLAQRRPPEDSPSEASSEDQDEQSVQHKKKTETTAFKSGSDQTWYEPPAQPGDDEVRPADLSELISHLRSSEVVAPWNPRLPWALPSQCRRLQFPPATALATLKGGGTVVRSVVGDLLDREFSALDGDLKSSASAIESDQGEQLGGVTDADLVGMLDGGEGDGSGNEGEGGGSGGRVCVKFPDVDPHLVAAVRRRAVFQGERYSDFQTSLFKLWRSRFSNAVAPSDEEKNQSSAKDPCENDEDATARPIGRKRLVYFCHPHNLCGGHGDRTNGMLGGFLLALLLDRDFFIDADNPVPLSMLFEPAHLDWRVAHSAVASTPFTSTSTYYHLDARFHHDIDLIVDDPSQTIFLSANLRELGQFFAHDRLRARAQQLFLVGSGAGGGAGGNPEVDENGVVPYAPAIEFLMRQAFEFLFRHTFFVQMQVWKAREQLRIGMHEHGTPPPLRDGDKPGGEGSSSSVASPEATTEDSARTTPVVYRPYVAIHFRAGNESAWWDPSRHSLETVDSFLECAKKAETELFGPLAPLLDIPYFLSADTPRILEVPAVAALVEKKKIVVLEDQSDREVVAHVDRSKGVRRLNGLVPSYVAYKLLSEAAAIVMSRSWFGETAAELGPSGKQAYFAGNGGCVKTDLMTS